MPWNKMEADIFSDRLIERLIQSGGQSVAPSSRLPCQKDDLRQTAKRHTSFSFA